MAEAEIGAACDFATRIVVRFHDCHQIFSVFCDFLFTIVLFAMYSNVFLYGGHSFGSTIKGQSCREGEDVVEFRGFRETDHFVVSSSKSRLLFVQFP